MTGITYITGYRMRHCFTKRRHVIVATQTAVCSLIVYKGYYHRNPHISAMAGFTQITGHRMGYRFKGTGTDAIMTTGTGARLPCYGGMIE